ncbi:biotin/lipoyl-containing protein [Falsihalocynthiibacter arcticus]|uniref:biotin/lipoyl-containing protein n=1 Tax=Falsihalocynthiibacter arcticus TaxID=1579316 RepID=UPI003001E17C
MAHEVIMPALGMAQETGKIVSWQKQAGDAVKIGDVLMEVETDKAIMDVEALADGYLGSISAAAGEDVPVGQVIALISDKIDAAPAVSHELPMASTEPPTGQSIIMPALGMAQETGLIVAWHKAPGDKVGAEDILLEVETDKSTMEVPAGHDGFISALLADSGQEVPVGDVIAVISTTAPKAPFQSTAETRKPAQEPVGDPSPAPVELKAATATQIVASNPVVVPGSRIFASPKTRRLAAEQGLDLGRLVAIGHPQPYHVADLEKLHNLPLAELNNEVQSLALPNQITARVPSGGTQDFLDWMQEEGNVTLAPSTIWIAFAAAALRSALEAGDDILVISLMDLQAKVRSLTNPDRARLSCLTESDPDAVASLILRDLSDSPITGIRLAGSKEPSLSITTLGNDYQICLDFTTDQLSDLQAIQFITEFSDRLTDPLRHLL